jgi:2-hydroxyglutarate dehydrogenase
MSLAAAAANISRKSFDVIIVGGGIVGCATARNLKIVKPHLNVGLIDKESHVAAHQSGHNSGVLHAGIYYKPGTLKAKLCVEGIDLAYDYLEKKNIPHKKVGKLIVAVEEKEVPDLLTLYERALENKCKEIQLVDAKRIKEIEPNCRGLRAIWSPYTGIVDWGLVTKFYAEDFKNDGGEILFNHELKKIELSSGEYPVRLSTSGTNSQLECKYLITCAGLHSDRVARLSGCSRDPKIIPFRGEYLKLKPHMKNLVRTNIYPVPDPRFPFLGVHFTPNMNGDILLGPNAVLAFAREGYNYSKLSPKDVIDAVFYPGMLKLMLKYAAFGSGEMWRSIYHRAQVKLLQRFIVPELKASDVERGIAGVRAQAMDADGNLVDDFVFDGGEGALGSRVLHVRNAPSPGATSSLAIAKMVVDKASDKFSL